MKPSIPPRYHSPQIAVDVRLNTNESPWPPPQGFSERLATEMSRIQWNRYPDREAVALREALAARHGIDVSNVFCSNGSNESIQLLLAAYGGPGRSATVFSPTYALHSHLCRLSGTAVEEHWRGDDFALTANIVKSAASADKADVIFLSMPNNPTGTMDDPSVVDAALSGRSLVVVDEAYGEFGSLPSLASRASAENLAVVRTFSKAWAMAGLRLGYTVAGSSVVSEMFERALPYHLDVVKQAAGHAALAFEDEMQDRVAKIRRERERVLAALRELAVTAWDSAANFVLFRPATIDAVSVWNGLVERSVLVRDLSGQEGLVDCLRVTIGAPAENDRFLGALAEVLASGGER
ncbi:MAG: histidinol-phosphate transaminase [Actinobacteria bacterium]|nr:histidinol-phosphate transaminase [Actinomycetota bacterium]